VKIRGWNFQALLKFKILLDLQRNVSFKLSAAAKKEKKRKEKLSPFTVKTFAKVFISIKYKMFLDNFA
jgi:hypothetical protein